VLPIQVRGIRGAITVRENTAESIMSAVKELLSAVVRENQIKLEDIASVFITATEDLNAEFPALAAREMGWRHVPLLCAREINVPGAMARVIRVLLHVNTDRSPNELKHLYLREAAGLRPDLGKTD
jgi:chorismate mutase